MQIICFLRKKNASALIKCTDSLVGETQSSVEQCFLLTPLTSTSAIVTNCSFFQLREVSCHRKCANTHIVYRLCRLWIVLNLYQFFPVSCAQKLYFRPKMHIWAIKGLFTVKNVIFPPKKSKICAHKSYF